MSFAATSMFPGDFQDSAARLAATAVPGASGDGSASEAWRQMLALGWQAVLVDESAGGAGGSLAELASIIEATARHALPAPLIERCAIAPALLAASVAREPAKAALAAVAAGEASVCPVLDATAPLQLDGQGNLQGKLKGADLSEPASHLLFAARESDGTPVLLLLPCEPLQQRARRFRGVDGRITVDFDLRGWRCAPEAVVLRGERVTAAIAEARQVAMLLVCVQAVAAAGAMIEQTIAYLNTRSQFGVLLSTFQALRHRAVEMYVAYENGRGLVRQLVLADGAPSAERERDITMTKLYIDGVARDIAEAAIQLHGGMGMSQETLAARIAVHSLSSSLRYGDSASCLDTLAAGVTAEVAAG